MQQNKNSNAQKAAFKVFTGLNYDLGFTDLEGCHDSAKGLTHHIEIKWDVYIFVP